MHSQIRSEINVTPLVDVAMVVLIIFMVVTPLVSQGPDVALPATSHPEQLAEDTQRTDVTLRADGTVFVDDLPIPRAALEGALRGRNAAASTVVVRADHRLPYREVREVLELLAATGSKDAALETRREPSNSR
jgi:biopolymer transport protein ExbD